MNTIDTQAVWKEYKNWINQKKINALWNHDPKLWTNEDEAKWMGWLDPQIEMEAIPEIESLSLELKNEGITDIIVLGMGGSSLCPDMLAIIFGKINDFPRLHVLDSTDPKQIHTLDANIDLKNSFFIVSSKSGSTLEPNIFLDYFYTRLQNIMSENVGKRFIAITDPGTSLVKKAEELKFRKIFYGLSVIGGRYSALSNFGMVPAGLMGIPIKPFLQHADEMRRVCELSGMDDDNPGVFLGVILGVFAKRGNNKITFIITPEIAALGSWLEQLLAESTGKDGKGLIPIDNEPLGKSDVYGNDRLFVYIRHDLSALSEQDEAIHHLETKGFSVVKINVSDKMHLGAEFYRWEIATAVAGSILGINPFNQPNVEEAKQLAMKIAGEYDQSHHLPDTQAFMMEKGISLYTDEKNLQALQQIIAYPSIREYVHAHLQRLNLNDYFNISAFIEMSADNVALLQACRLWVRDHKKVATCLGFGPRFLHSTGQLYKGGPNTGVFIQITADHKDDIKVPHHQYTFGNVIHAQAQADFSVLSKQKRRILRVHLSNDGVRDLKHLLAILKE